MKVQPQSQRQLQVGAELRAAIAALMQRGDMRDPDLLGQTHKITVTEVSISPDLKHATVYVMPLGGQNSEKIMPALIRAAPYFQAEVGRMVKLRFTPRLHFKLDDTFDRAFELETILRSEHVARDLAKRDEEDEE